MTFIARNGQKGGWYIDVDEYAPRIPVLHYELIGPGGLPWPQTMQFLKGNAYDQPCPGPNWREKEAQIKRINELHGLVCMTRDYWSHPPGSSDASAIRIRMQDRDGYVGLFWASNARFERKHQRFILGKQECLLRRPGQA